MAAMIRVNYSMGVNDMYGYTIWLIGPSGVGKSTLSQWVCDELGQPNIKTLDGDEIRKGISSDLGLSSEDRSENNRRVAYLARAISDVGGLAIVATICPFEKDREIIRQILDNKVTFICLTASKEELIRRDPKGLYDMAINGKITGLTGYDGIFEVPNDALFINTEADSINACGEKILSLINYGGLS